MKNKIAQHAISSMNYFFLKEVFEEGDAISERLKLKSDFAYEKLISEIGFFLESIDESYIDDDIREIISIEMYEGDYLKNLSMEEISDTLSKGIEDICGYANISAARVYIKIASNVKKRMIYEQRKLSELDNQINIL